MKDHDYILTILRNPANIASIEKPSIHLCWIALSLDGSVLQYIPDATEDMCMMAIKTSEKAFRYVQTQTQKLCDQAVEFCSENIKYVRDEFKTVELCQRAINDNPNLMEFVSPQLLEQMAPPLVELSHEIPIDSVKLWPETIGLVSDKLEYQLEAIDRDPMSIRYIPNPSRELIIRAIESEIDVLDVIEVPEDILLQVLEQDPLDIMSRVKNPSDDLCMKAIELNPSVIRVIDHPSPDMCALAVRLDPTLIAHVPDPPEELVLSAVRACPHMVTNVEQTTAVCFEAVGQNPRLIGRIREPSEELCLFAIEKDPEAIAFMIEPSQVVVEKALERCVYAIHKTHVLDRRLCQMAFQLDPREIAGVEILEHMCGCADDEESWYACKTCNTEHNKRALELAEYPLSLNPFSISVLSLPFRDSDLLREIIRENPMLLQDVKMPSEELCLLAVEILPYVLRFVPLNRQSRRVCTTAVSRDPRLVIYVIDDFLRKELLETYQTRFNMTKKATHLTD